MYTPDPDQTFNTPLAEFSVEPQPKYTETRGYIYLVQDSVFPDHIKIGRTADIVKRLVSYNNPKPFPTARLVCISRQFADVISVEARILEALYKIIEPTTFRKEWFEIKHKDLCISAIQEAEIFFSDSFSV